ncbi:hypothetical protein [Mobiluncus mulieris]|uniref:hypothetical protein n=1 Tax=Mobiluncus mulieris TaxID=2052 RepID=UPI002092C00F|nr:hypothetical protein [Mobiluncus mulieris]
MLILRGKLQLFSLPANLLTGAVSSIVTVGGLVLVALAAITHLGITLANSLSPRTGQRPDFRPVQPSHRSNRAGHRAGRELDSGGGAVLFTTARCGNPWIESGYGIFGILVVTLAFLWLAGRYAYLRHWSVSLGSPFRFHEVPF